MATLLISKINNIRIMQDGDSVLSSKNKKQESSKVGHSKENGQTKNKGTNTTIDLGKGAEKHTLKFFVIDRNENDAILKIIRDDRKCVIVDKFKGKIKVYIDEYEIVDSDKHRNKTIFKINCTVQDVEYVPTINFTAKLKNISKDMEKEIAEKVNDIVKDISSVDTILDVATNTESFIDSIMKTIEDGIMAVVDLQSDMLNAYKSVKDRVEKVKRLIDTLKNILKFPQMFIDLMLSVTDEEKKQNAEIFEVMIGKKKLSEINIDELSQIQYAEVTKEAKATQLNNLVTATMEIKQALNTEFNSQQEFEKHIEVTLNRLEHIGYTWEQVVEKQQILKSYANEQKYRSVKDIEVKSRTPLTVVVYNLYGNLDKYDEIEKLNNLKDNDIVYGTIKVYDENNN